MKSNVRPNILDWPEQSQTSPKITFVRVSSSSPETMLMSHLFCCGCKLDSFFTISNFILLGCGILWGQSDFPASTLHKNIQNIRNVREAQTHFIPFCLFLNYPQMWPVDCFGSLSLLPVAHPVAFRSECTTQTPKQIQKLRHKKKKNLNTSMNAFFAS